jgi:hypothetical protein
MTTLEAGQYLRGVYSRLANRWRCLPAYMRLFICSYIWVLTGDDHIDGMRLHLWTATTKGPIVHPPGDIWACRTTVEWSCRQRKTTDSPTRVLWYSYQQSHLVASRRKAKGNYEFWLAKYFCLYLQVIFTYREILRHGTSGFTYPRKEGVLRIFIVLQNPSPRPGLNPRILGPIASTLTITPLRRLSSKMWQ